MKKLIVLTGLLFFMAIQIAPALAMVMDHTYLVMLQDEDPKKDKKSTATAKKAEGCETAAKSAGCETSAAKSECCVTSKKAMAKSGEEKKAPATSSDEKK